MRSSLLPTQTTKEYKRSGQRIAASEVRNDGTPDVNRSMTDLAQRLRENVDPGAFLQGLDRWRTRVLQLTLQDMICEGHRLPYVKDIRSVLTGVSLGRWDLVHFSAQYQAEYYSLRFLKQICQYLRSGLPVSEGDDPGQINAMAKLLEQLPSVGDFLGRSTQETKEGGSTALLTTIEDIVRNLTISDIDVDASEAPKQRGDNERLKETNNRGKPSSNPFDILAPLRN